MPLASPLRQRASTISLVAIASAFIALTAALVAISTVSLLPPKLAARHLDTAGATTRVMVDLPASHLTDRRVSWEYFGVVSARAALLAQVMVSRPALEHVGRRAGIAPDRIATVAPVTASVVSALTEPGSEKRAAEILLSRRPYRLEVQARPNAPLIDIYAQAPSTREAELLADGAISGLRDYLRDQAERSGFDPGNQVTLRQVGRPHGAVLNPGARMKIAGMTFFAAFVLSFVALLALLRLRAGRSRGAHASSWPAAAAGPPGELGLAAAAPGPVALRWEPPKAESAVALPLKPSKLRFALGEASGSNGDWPRTTRVLPWTLAAFMAVLWLVPFDSIQLSFSTPVDMKLDRLLLPFVILIWMLAVLAGGRDAPRLRMSWIHAAVGTFVALAWLSVVVNAPALTGALELGTSLKKLPLLLAYISMFLMVASVVRRSEVGAFLKYTLILAVICAIGIVIEYRTQQNLFFEWSSKLLPGVFDVEMIHSGYDFGGRRTTHGPAMHGLVAVAMLALAMPIAIVGAIHAKDWRGRILYGLATCVLMVAVLATQRKTAIVAPVTGILTLAYFRRRELLKLTPVAVALLVGLVIVSPGTIEPVVTQFQPDQLEANTVSDRGSDYDAVRPDVWTHLVLGRGYGSYQPIGHRILDSEILVRTVEMGVVGLFAFLFLGVSVILATRRLIASRHPQWAPSALACAAAAVTFTVVAALFDSMSFPQVPYIFLCLAALVTALITTTDREARQTG
jgi:hypothetical protein